MGLFQKRPEIGNNLPLYTIGTTKSYLIIGLGNPEKKYADTRHNIGFEVLDYFAEQNNFPAWINKKDLKSEVSIANLGENRVILSKPTTYMNNSGEAAQALQHFYRIYNTHTLALYDELAISFGQLRTRMGGSDAGHNGVKSLIQHIGDEFGRLRIGIGSEISKKADASNFVLGQFTKEEQGSLEAILREANSLINDYIFSSQLSPETRSAGV